MSLYNPQFLPSSESFEILVFLVLQKEHPESELHLLRAPDWGIDILRRDGKATFAYQCKHYPSPRKDLVKRGVEASLHSACKYRDIIKWRKITFCFSANLSAPQTAAIRKAADSFGLSDEEYEIRSGTAFLRTIAREPNIWELATSPAISFHPVNPLTSGIKAQLSDNRLERVFAKIHTLGTRLYVSDLLEETGIGQISSLVDWYEIALPFYRSTRSELRMMSLDAEIVMFWLTERGGPYLKMNKELLARGVSVKRIYVFDFALEQSDPTAFHSFLDYCAQQNELGLKCKIVPMEVFKERAPLKCQIFSVQDRNNVMLYAPDAFQVSFLKDPDVIAEASDAFDELFNHREAKSPTSLLDQK